MRIPNARSAAVQPRGARARSRHASRPPILSRRLISRLYEWLLKRATYQRCSHDALTVCGSLPKPSMCGKMITPPAYWPSMPQLDQRLPALITREPRKPAPWICWRCSNIWMRRKTSARSNRRPRWSNAAPDFHYRLPDCLIDQPGWGLQLVLGGLAGGGTPGHCGPRAADACMSICLSATPDSGLSPALLLDLGRPGGPQLAGCLLYEENEPLPGSRARPRCFGPASGRLCGALVTERHSR